MRKQMGSILVALAFSSASFQLYATGETMENFDHAVERNRNLPIANLENSPSPAASRIWPFAVATLSAGILTLVGTGIGYAVCEGDKEICEPPPGCNSSAPTTLTLGAMATLATSTVTGCVQNLVASGSGSGDDGSGLEIIEICRTEEGCRDNMVIGLVVGAGITFVGTLLWLVPHLAAKLRPSQTGPSDPLRIVEAIEIRRTTSGPLRRVDIAEI